MIQRVILAIELAEMLVILPSEVAQAERSTAAIHHWVLELGGMHPVPAEHDRLYDSPGLPDRRSIRLIAILARRDRGQRAKTASING